MEPIRGQLRYGGEICLETLRGEVEFHGRLRRVPTAQGPWSGSFEVPDGAWIQAGGPYELVLQDGRFGRILIRRSAVAFDRPAIAEFIGAGPLQSRQRSES
jgi:hypothetical protein